MLTCSGVRKRSFFTVLKIKTNTHGCLASFPEGWSKVTFPGWLELLDFQDLPLLCGNWSCFVSIIRKSQNTFYLFSSIDNGERTLTVKRVTGVNDTTGSEGVFFAKYIWKKVSLAFDVFFSYWYKGTAIHNKNVATKMPKKQKFPEINRIIYEGKKCQMWHNRRSFSNICNFLDFMNRETNGFFSSFKWVKT